MIEHRGEVSPHSLRKTRLLLLATAIATTLALALALPAMAASARAVKSKVAPVYPEIAKRLRISGEVRVEATVDPDGKVSDVRPVSGNGTLSAATEDAVRKWRFAPAPEASTVELSFNFGGPE